MSSLSWDYPSPVTNPSADDDSVETNGSEGHDDTAQIEPEPSVDDIETLEREQLEQFELEQLAKLDALEGGEIAALERERDELEQLEMEQIAALEAQRNQLERQALSEAAQLEREEQSERDELEELEREQLRQLEQMARDQGLPMDPPEPAPAPSRRAEPRPSRAPAGTAAPAVSAPAVSAPAVSAPAPASAAPWRPGADAEARAAQFLAEATARQSSGDASSLSSGPTIERRELSEPARAARAIVEHRHRNLVEANALLTEARRVLAPIAYRGLSDRIYRRRKIILAIGEAASLAVAFSAAFDVAPLEALLLSGAIALAFVIAGDLGGILRITAERSRLTAAMDDDAVNIDPRYLHILYHDHQPWLSIIGGVTAGVFGLATVSVGVLRAANQGSVGLAAGLGLLTVSLAIAAGLSSWQHASIGSEIIDHLQREEEAAARRLKRAAAARVLRRPQIMGSVRSDELDLPSPSSDIDWPPALPAPDADWETPTPELRPKRALLAGRPARAKAPKREKSGGGLGVAAAKGAVFLATLPGRFRRPDKDAKAPKAAKASRADVLDDSDSGPGPGAGGESAGSISDIQFRPPVIIPKKFG